MTTIYLIRHGQASLGTSNYDVLSDLGRRQSKLLGKFFEQTQLDFNRIYSGTLQRQIDTAQLSLNVDTECFTQHVGFNEYQHSKIFDYYRKLIRESSTTDDLPDNYNNKLTFETFSALMNAWVDDNQPHDELESWDQFQHRINKGLREVIDAHGSTDQIAIFTSGGVISTILQMITGFPTEKIFEINWGIFNASITTVKTSGSSLKLSYYNSIAHLLLENNDSLVTNI